MPLLVAVGKAALELLERVPRREAAAQVDGQAALLAEVAGSR